MADDGHKEGEEGDVFTCTPNTAGLFEPPDQLVHAICNIPAQLAEAAVLTS